jgi:hypothetical protein
MSKGKREKKQEENYMGLSYNANIAILTKTSYSKRRSHMREGG